MREQIQKVAQDPDTQRLIFGGGVFTYSMLANMAVIAQQIGMIAAAIVSVWILIDRIHEKTRKHKKGK